MSRRERRMAQRMSRKDGVQKAKKTEIKLTDEEIKAASDARRAQQPKKNIRIHAHSIEDVDETLAREKKAAVKPEETGYKSKCRLIYRESRLNWLRKWASRLLAWTQPIGVDAFPQTGESRVELSRKFVKDKVVTRCVTLISSKMDGEQCYFLQPVPLEYLKKTEVWHVEKKALSWLRRYPYYATIDGRVTPPDIFVVTGVNPLLSKSVEYELKEIYGKDRELGMQHFYKMKAVGSYVPMR